MCICVCVFDEKGRSHSVQVMDFFLIKGTVYLRYGRSLIGLHVAGLENEISTAS